LRVTLDLSRAFAYLLTLGIFVQSCYLIIGDLASKIILFGTGVALLVVGSALLWRSGVQRTFMLVPGYLFTFCLCCFIAWAAVARYEGADLFGFLQPVVMLIALVVLSMVISGPRSQTLIESRYLWSTIILIAVAHAYQLYGARDVVASSLNYVTQRYGYVDGINKVNLTADNLAFVSASAYLLSKSINNTVWRGMLTIASVSLFFPLAATGSRSALLMASAAIFLFELRQRRLNLSSLFVLAIVLAVGFAIQTTDLGGALGGLISARFYSYSPILDPSSALRLDAVLAALEGGFFLLGSGLSGAEYIGRSPDNTFAEISLGYGVLGFIVFTIFILLALNQMYRSVAGSRVPLFVLLPIFIQSLSEGFYLERSTLFGMFFFVLCGANAVARGGRGFKPIVPSKGASLLKRWRSSVLSEQ
jgi:hypothetical protein